MKSLIGGMLVMVSGLFFIGDDLSVLTDNISLGDVFGVGLLGLGFGIVIGRCFGGVANN